MKKKWYKRIFIICCILLIIVGIAGVIGYYFPITIGGKAIQVKENLESGQILSKEEIGEDREQLIELVESIHPAFVDGSDLSKYEEAKNHYIQATDREMTVDEFRYETGAYLAALNDGHTRLWRADENTFEIWHKYTDGHMYYYRYEDGETVPTGLYVTEVNGVSIDKILDVIDYSVPAENEYAREVNYNDYFTSESVLKLAGVEISGDFVEVSLSDGSVERCSYFVPKESNGDIDETGNRWKWDGDVFVVIFEECIRDEGFRDMVSELKKAVKNGCSKVIIDVRNNGGGNSDTCTELLEAMGMKAPEYGMMIRYSEEAKNQVGYLRTNGTYTYEPKNNGEANPSIDLVVLYNKNTFSSANMMCVYVRDGGLGVLIGEPCKNSPSHYGQPIEFSLEHSHLNGSISHKAFTRPNGDWSEKVLLPDVEMVGNDSYQTAIDFLTQ